MNRKWGVIMLVAAASAATQAQVWSEERGRDLPSYTSVRESLGDMDDFRDRMRRQPPPAGEETPKVSAPACEAFVLDGAQMRAKLFSSDTEITAPDGKLAAVLSDDGDRLVLRSPSGGIMASAAVKRTRGGETAEVSGCDGKPLGSIVMTETGWGDRSFVVKGSAGTELASSESIGYLQSSYALQGPGLSVSIKSNHWFYDSYLVSVRGESRLAAFIVELNSDANRHESTRRRHENHHGPRGDR